MKALLLAAIVAAALVPSVASPQLSLRVELGVPLPPAPAMVVVQPGIQVVAGYPEEVFFTSGYYWLRRDTAWYRSIEPRTGFVVVPAARVPPGLTRLPPGHFRHYTREQARKDREAWKAHKAHDKQEKHARAAQAKGHDH